MKRVRFIRLGILLGLAGIGSAQAQSPNDVSTARVTVPRNVETKVGQNFNWTTRGSSTLCMTRYIAALELVTPPSHGTVRFSTGEGNPANSGCSNTFTGAIVLYKPMPNFVGTDQFTYKIPADPMTFNHVGPSQTLRNVIVTVQ
jgi:hypothetical protein